MAARTVPLPGNGLRRTRLVSNESPNDHHAALEELLRTATSIKLAVAFLKAKGLEKISPMLEARLKAGAKVDIFVGRDFCLTEPRNLAEYGEISFHGCCASSGVVAHRMNGHGRFVSRCNGCYNKGEDFRATDGVGHTAS